MYSAQGKLETVCVLHVSSRGSYLDLGLKASQLLLKDGPADLKIDEKSIPLAGKQALMMATTQLQLQIGVLRAMQLAVVVVTCVPLGRMHHLVEATTPNRAADGYSNSGYMWPKTLIWHGLRSSPGSLWAFYGTVISSSCQLLMTLLMTLGRLLQRNPMSEFEQALSNIGPVFVTGALLYVTACVNQLSDVVEAYLAGMVTVQMLIPSLLVQTGSRIPRLLLISGLQISAVLGTAMLDSYRPLELLNLVYSVVGTLLLAGIVFTDMIRDPQRRAVCNAMACFVQMGFTIAAFIVADNVQGSHRKPMLSMLITACLFTLLSSPLVIAIIISTNDENDDVL